MASPFSFSSPLPEDAVRFAAMNASEGLSDLGEMRLNLLSKTPDLQAEDLLGKPVTVHMALSTGGERSFNGYVTRLTLATSRGRYHGWEATVRPWLWFLTRTADCRIFQELTVPDIVKKVFEDHSIACFEFKLLRSYEPWVYCVQYRESDYNFITRLLEHEGIYWYFEHRDGTHKLVLVDSLSAHDPIEGDPALPYYEDPGQRPSGTEYISNWRFQKEVRTGKVVLTSYDFERPSTPLQVEHAKVRPHDLADHELFDFQGDYVKAAEGSQWVEDRTEEHQARFQRLSGTTNGQHLAVGHTVTLKNHPRDDQNASYLITSLAVRASVEGDESGATPGGFTCDFTAIPADQQYRPRRHTRKPCVQGPQTAVVVGPGGEELFTDKYGRVKVQFHWDRYGKKDEKSSCWVRVSHPWAGKNFGLVQIPRIGQEVVVDFLEGDPDQPLITGRVYNAEQMPPWELPANATQSGILTRSSKGGSYDKANAIRFEDKAGNEQLWIHAEKNQDIEVENDETHSVGHDRRKTIDHDETTLVKHDRTETVGHNETITIALHRTESVGSNETITIGANRTETVGANETINIAAHRSITVGATETATVALQRTHAVGLNETIAIGAAQEVAIGAAQIVAVGAMQSISVGAHQSTNVGTNRTVKVGANQTTTIGADRSTKVGGNSGAQISGDQSISVGKRRSTSVADDDSVKVGKNLVIDAGDSVSIRTGSASITMKKDGTIVIKGKDITIDGSGKINVKAGGDVVMKGSKILQN